MKHDYTADELGITAEQFAEFSEMANEYGKTIGEQLKEAIETYIES